MTVRISPFNCSLEDTLSSGRKISSAITSMSTRMPKRKPKWPKTEYGPNKKRLTQPTDSWLKTWIKRKYPKNTPEKPLKESSNKSTPQKPKSISPQKE